MKKLLLTILLLIASMTTFGWSGFWEEQCEILPEQLIYQEVMQQTNKINNIRRVDK